MVDRIVIEPVSSKNTFLSDVVNYRELLLVFAAREVLVRYKQTVFGALWAILQPLITMFVISYIFGNVIGLKNSVKVPYYIFVLTGVLPWFVFSSVLSSASTSLIENSSLVTKVYFPRVILPLSTSMVSIVDFFINFCLLLIILLVNNIGMNISILLVPISLLLSVMSAVGLGLLFCAMNVRYRDFRYIVPFVIQFGLYVSPIGYSVNGLEGFVKYVYAINPMVAAIDLMRCGIIEDMHLDVLSLIIGCFSMLLFMVMGSCVFKSMEQSMADMI